MDGKVKRIGNALCSVGLSASVALFAGEAIAQNGPPESTRVLRWETARENPVLTAIALQPAGRLIAAAGDTHSIHIWDRESGAAKWELKGHSDWVRSLAISPDGRTLVSGGNDGRVLIWDLESGQLKSKLDQREAAIRSLVFGHSGTMVAVATFGEPLRVFHVDTKQELFQLDAPCQDIGAVSFSPDDWRLAAGGRNGLIRIWNLKDNTAPVEYRAHTRRVRDIQFLGDNVISCGDDGRIVRNNMSQSAPETIAAVKTRLFCLAAPDADNILCGGADNVVRQFSLNTGRQLESFHGHEGTVAAISVENDSIATCGFDTTVRIWRRSPVAEVREIQTNAPLESPAPAEKQAENTSPDEAPKTGEVSTANKLNRIEPLK